MERKHNVGRIIGSIIIILLTILLLPILIMNIILIVKGSLNTEVPPDIFGIAPLAVQTDDMEGEEEGCFSDGALIFVDLLSEEEKQSLTTGDVVTFRWENPSAPGQTAFVTYRIRSVERDEDTGLIVSITALGDNISGDVSDPVPVPIEDVLGVYLSGIDGLGAFAMFLQTPIGVLVFVGIPVVAYVLYDIIRVTLHNRRVRAEEKEELTAKEEELARLRALVGGDTPATAPAEGLPVEELSSPAPLADSSTAADMAAPAQVSPAADIQPVAAPEELPVESGFDEFAGFDEPAAPAAEVENPIAEAEEEVLPPPNDKIIP